MTNFPRHYHDLLDPSPETVARWDILREDTVAQIAKDFSFYAETWTSVATDWDAVLQDLAAKLHGLQHVPHKLHQLVYRIDVKQSELEALLGRYSGDEAWRQLAGLIWHREMKKVWLRRSFSPRISGKGEGPSSVLKS